MYMLLCTTATNAAYLGKHGCWSIISKMLEGAARKNYMTLRSVHCGYMYLNAHEEFNFFLYCAGCVWIFLLVSSSKVNYMEALVMIVATHT